MADCFYGEIRIFAFAFPPANWAQCNGQKILISQNQVLYAIFGNTFGGDMKTYYNLPNSQTLAMAGTDPNGVIGYPIVGEVEGVNSVTITNNTYPDHDHAVQAAFTTTPSGYVNVPTSANVLGRANNENVYVLSSTQVALSESSVSYSRSTTVQTQPHENRQPYLAMNFCICLQGEYFPSRPN